MAQTYKFPERPETYEQASPTTNLVEMLERILDKGLVVVGDIRVAVADMELLRIQLRLLIASVDKAKELGVDLDWVKGIDSYHNNGRRLVAVKPRNGKSRR